MPECTHRNTALSAHNLTFEFRTSTPDFASSASESRHSGIDCAPHPTSAKLQNDEHFKDHLGANMLAPICATEMELPFTLAMQRQRFV